MIPFWSASRAIAVGLILRIGVAIWNGVYGPSFGAGADAATFHRFATVIAEGGVPIGIRLTGYTYAQVLGQVYRVTGPSLLIGSLLSCAAWLASVWVLRASLRMLDIGGKSHALALWIYALLPSSVLWTAVTLREPYQLLCVTTMLFASLRILRRQTLWSSALLLTLSIIVGTFLHAALLILGTAIGGTMLLRLSLAQARSARAKTAVVVAVMVIAMVAGVSAFRTLYANYSFSEGLVGAMELHLSHGMKFYSRTLYLSDPNIAGNSGLVIAVGESMFKYLFEPMPWNANQWIDAGYIAENVLRALLIGSAIGVAVRHRGAARAEIVMMLVWYFTLEATWAVGTFNWGTAARHHLPSIGLLLAAGLAHGGGLMRPRDWTVDRA